MKGSKWSQAPADTFRKIQMGAGMFVSSFTPGVSDSVTPLFATDGGANFTATPQFIDLADGIDNIPPNTKELKEIDYWEVTISGTGKTVDADTVKRFLGGADVDNDHVTPRNYLKDTDFEDFWWIGSVGKSGSEDTDYLAIHLKNALSTDGFQMQSQNRDKGSFPFNFTAHYSISDVDEVPFEVYVSVTTSA